MTAQAALQLLEIADMGARGEGIALVDDKPVFIAGTLKGESVRALIEGNRGRLEAVVSASPERVEPGCKHFGSCGGCQLQHWDRQGYRQWKRQLLVTALERAGIETDVAPLIDAEGAGRRRATLHGRREGAGFNGLRSHEVHDLDQCPVLVPELAEAADITRACYRALGDCDVSLTATDTGIDVAIRAKARGAYKPLTNIAMRYKLARLALNGEDIIINRPPEVRMGTAMVRLPAGSFLQATAAAEEIIGAEIVTACKGAKRVADLFCGVGPFALRLAANAKTFAVDSDRQAVAACDAALRGTPGLKIMGTETRDLMRDPLVPMELKPFDAVVLDPPRAGAEAQARELAQSKVKLVVMVSCDPVSFARDAAILIAGGYRLEKVTPIDQFIWSAHLETVAVFRR